MLPTLKVDEENVFSKNKSLNDFMAEIEKTGGIGKDSAEFIRYSGKEFREDFEFQHDQE